MRKPNLNRSKPKYFIRHPLKTKVRKSWFLHLELPRINLRIPALLKFRYVLLDKLTIVSFFVGFLVMAIILVFSDLVKQEANWQNLNWQHQALQQQIAYWQDVTNKYTNYRDGFFQLALLNWQLGQTTQALEFVNKSLAIDPNFSEAKNLEKEMGK